MLVLDEITVVVAAVNWGGLFPNTVRRCLYTMSGLKFSIHRENSIILLSMTMECKLNTCPAAGRFRQGDIRGETSKARK